MAIRTELPLLPQDELKLVNLVARGELFTYSSSVVYINKLCTAFPSVLIIKIRQFLQEETNINLLYVKV